MNRLLAVLLRAGSAILALVVLVNLVAAADRGRTGFAALVVLVVGAVGVALVMRGRRPPVEPAPGFEPLQPVPHVPAGVIVAGFAALLGLAWAAARPSPLVTPRVALAGMVAIVGGIGAFVWVRGSQAVRTWVLLTAGIVVLSLVVTRAMASPAGPPTAGLLSALVVVAVLWRRGVFLVRPALKALERGDLRAALGHAHYAVEQGPTQWVTWHTRALTHLLRGEFERAESDARQCVALASREWTCHAILADVLVQQGRYEEAEMPSRAAFTTAPRLWPNPLRLGLVLVRLGRWNEAADLLRQAQLLRMSPGGRLRAAVLLARAHRGLGDEKGAVLALESSRRDAEALPRLTRELRRVSTGPERERIEEELEALRLAVAVE